MITPQTFAFDAEQPFTWQHRQISPDLGATQLDDLDLPSVVAQALCATETRPRCTPVGDGFILILRGVNLNPGSEPEDMVSLRLWITQDTVVSTYVRQLKAVQDTIDAVSRNQTPTGPVDLVAQRALRLADRAEPVVATLNERVDAMEELMLSGQTPEHYSLSDVRRMSIVLRRYMFPQRDALNSLEIDETPLIAPHDRAKLREATDRMTRLAEDLDALRDRAQVVSDQMAAARADRMNSQMLVLSVVAAIFLPLGLITGLLGINVGGMPGAENSNAFWIVCIFLVAAGVALWGLFKSKGWFRN